MKVQQVFFTNPDFYRYFDEISMGSKQTDFFSRNRAMLAERFMSPHILKPALDGSDDFFFSYANDRIGCELWAKENQLKSSHHYDVLEDQIKQFKPDVLYIMHPFMHGPSFINRIRSDVGSVVCWHAGPHLRGSFDCFDKILSNFPPYLETWRGESRQAYMFQPSIDDAMIGSQSSDRPVDISFIGNIGGPNHKRRTQILDQLVKDLGEDYSYSFHGIVPQFVSAFPKSRNFLKRIPLPKRVISKRLANVVEPPVFGRKLYETLGRSKICMNIAINTAQKYVVNMRCFEALGCGCCMVGEAGVYPEHFRENKNYLKFDGERSLASAIEETLSDSQRMEMIAAAGTRMVETQYSKTKQWENFTRIVD